MLRRSLSSLIGLAVMVSSIFVLAGSVSAQCVPSTNSSPCNDFVTATATSSAAATSDLPGTGGVPPAALLTVLPAILLVGGGLLSARLMRRMMRRS
jgi:uncharacterized membrane protein YphA (DoxX/SURF4 family)